MDLISGWGLALSGFAALIALAAFGVVAWRAVQTDPWFLPLSERYPVGSEGPEVLAPSAPPPDYITRAEAAVMIAEAVNAAIRQCRDDLAQHRARDDRRMR